MNNIDPSNQSARAESSNSVRNKTKRTEGVVGNIRFRQTAKLSRRETCAEALGEHNQAVPSCEMVPLKVGTGPDEVLARFIAITEHSAAMADVYSRVALSPKTCRLPRYFSALSPTIVLTLAINTGRDFRRTSKKYFSFKDNVSSGLQIFVLCSPRTRAGLSFPTI